MLVLKVNLLTHHAAAADVARDSDNQQGIDWHDGSTNTKYRLFEGFNRNSNNKSERYLSALKIVINTKNISMKRLNL